MEAPGLRAGHLKLGQFRRDALGELSDDRGLLRQLPRAVVGRDRRLSPSLHIPAVHRVRFAELRVVASQVLEIFLVARILRPRRLEQVPLLLLDLFGQPAHLHDRAHAVARGSAPARASRSHSNATKIENIKMKTLGTMYRNRSFFKIYAMKLGLW